MCRIGKHFRFLFRCLLQGIPYNHTPSLILITHVGIHKSVFGINERHRYHDACAFVIEKFPPECRGRAISNHAENDTDRWCHLTHTLLLRTQLNCLVAVAKPIPLQPVVSWTSSSVVPIAPMFRLTHFIQLQCLSSDVL